MSRKSKSLITGLSRKAVEDFDFDPDPSSEDVFGLEPTAMGSIDQIGSSPLNSDLKDKLEQWLTGKH